MAAAYKPHFEVDRAGLRKQLARLGFAWVPAELLQNAFDEPGVSRVTLSVAYVNRHALLTVGDDAPEGFADLSDAFTLFRQSKKGANAALRGRFNQGEKRVIAVADEATVATTSGTIVFNDSGRQHFPRRKRERGSLVQVSVPMSRAEYDEMISHLDLVIVPPGIEVVINDQVIEAPTPVIVFDETLTTERTDDDGNLRRTTRKAPVSLYEPLGGSGAWLYELGIPVVALGDDRWSVSVGQRVPLTTDRDAVPPSYLRDVRAAVLNHAHALLRDEDGAAKWVTEALADEKVTAEAARTAIHRRFGVDAVINDLSDPEAVRIAQSEGRQVIYGRMLPKDVWTQVKRHDVVKPAGQVTPSPKPYSPDGTRTRREMPRDEWTPGMVRMANFARWLADQLLGISLNVAYVNDPDAMNFAATWGRGALASSLEFNYRVQGRRWYDQPPVSEDVLRLLIHEMAHQREGNHLDRAYADEQGRLGARLALLMFTDPDEFAGWNAPLVEAPA